MTVTLPAAKAHGRYNFSGRVESDLTLVKVASRAFKRVGPMRAIISFLIAGMTLGGPAAAADCTLQQLQISSFSVIDPCTKRLEQTGLSDRDKSEAYFVRGRGYHRTHRWELARADYEAAVRLDPKNEEILLSWSNLDIRERHMQDYAARVEQAYALNPNNPHALRAVGGMFDAFGDGDKALEFYAKALSIDPNEPFALYLRALLRWDRDELKAAIADADALVSIPRQAIDEYGFLDKAGVLRDFHAIALALRAELLDAAGQRTAAAADFDAAVATERSATTLYKRGRFLRAIPERRGEGFADLEAAVVLEPRNDEAQYELGLALVELKRFDDAFHAFDAAVKARPRGPSLRMRARMHRELGRTDEAVRDYVTAIAVDPDERQFAINAMRAAGYWTSRELPRAVTPQLVDAVRACMIDTKCN